MKKNEIANIANLVYQDSHPSNPEIYSTITRYTNSVINGRFTGYGWYSMPIKTKLSPQECANEENEVVFYEDEGKYYYPVIKEKLLVKSAIGVEEGGLNVEI